MSEGLLALASRDAAGNLTLEEPESSLFEADVEISDEILVLKADDAQKLREPPRWTNAQARARPHNSWATVQCGCPGLLKFPRLSRPENVLSTGRKMALPPVVDRENHCYNTWFPQGRPR